MLSNKLLMVLLSFLVCTCAYATGNKSSATTSLDPVALLKKIENEGPKSVFDELNSEKWGDVIKGVETGSRPWLKVAVALHQVADAGFSEMLSLATAVALKNAPRDVLLISAQEFSIEGICSYPDMTDIRTNSQQKVVTYLNARIKAVTKLAGADVAPLRDQCLQSLEKTKEDIMSPDNPFSK